MGQGALDSEWRHVVMAGTYRNLLGKLRKMVVFVREDGTPWNCYGVGGFWHSEEC